MTGTYEIVGACLITVFKQISYLFWIILPISIIFFVVKIFGLASGK